MDPGLPQSGALVEALDKGDVAAVDATIVTLTMPLDTLQVKQVPLLHYCILKKCRLGMILHLVEAGAAFEIGNDAGSTSLHLAVAHERDALVHMLVLLGHQIDLHDHRKRSPLHLAAFYGHTFSVYLLLAAGAALKATTEKGETPLFLAAEQG